MALLAALLASCSPADRAVPPASPTFTVILASTPTPTSVATRIGTATPSTLSVPALKYRVLERFPDHPTTDGRLVGELRVGDSLDGGVVTSVLEVFYEAGKTYDLLPAGPTGFYWAGEVRLVSTLSADTAK